LYAEPIKQTNTNIAADSWFSSIKLVKKLKARRLTYVRILQKNKGEIPKEFTPSKSRELGSSLYGFTNNIILLSHVPKKVKQFSWVPPCITANKLSPCQANLK
jgi:hypothetical protein